MVPNAYFNQDIQCGIHERQQSMEETLTQVTDLFSISEVICKLGIVYRCF